MQDRSSTGHGYGLQREAVRIERLHIEGRGFAANDLADELPVAADMVTPSMPWPVAITRFFTREGRPSSGRSSYVIGRQPNHSSTTAGPSGSRRYSAAPRRSASRRVRLSESS